MGIRLRALAPLLLPLLAAVPYAAAQDKPPQPPAPGADPPAVPPPPAIAAQRARGVSGKVDAATRAGIDWLVFHQSPDGRWDADGFDDGCVSAKCAGLGESTFDTGVTGLAMLAILSRGIPAAGSPEAGAVARGRAYLVSIQDGEGCLAPRTNDRFMYSHAAAMMALAERLWLTRDESLLDPVWKARAFLRQAQNPYLGWRYGVRDGDNDTSVTAWCMLAIRTGELAGVADDHGMYDGPEAWFEKMRGADSMGYQRRGGGDARVWIHETPGTSVDVGGVRLAIGGGRLQSSDAEGADPSEPAFRRYPTGRWSALGVSAGAALAVANRRSAIELVRQTAESAAERPHDFAKAKSLDLHYLWFGSLLHAQHPIVLPYPATPEEARRRNPAWRPWRAAAEEDLLTKQTGKSPGACARGSWDPELDPFGAIGGRVYSTAMAVLALEAPNRFPKVWDPKAKAPKPKSDDAK